MYRLLLVTSEKKRNELLLLLLFLMTFTIQSHSIKWCARRGVSYNGVTELQQCNKLVAVLNDAKLSLDPSQVPTSLTESTFTCTESTRCETTALKDGEADLVMLDAKKQHAAGREWGAQPLNGQLFGTTFGLIESYSVAITTRQICESATTWADLKVQ